MKNETTRDTVPCAYITRSKQRVKQYNNSVYLKNGDQFEIELFNPKQTKVLASIQINGMSLGAGLVLKPGERVFLERFYDTPKKFLFETYEVEANNEDVQLAIFNNGKVVIKFYDEVINSSNPTFGSDWHPSVGHPSWTPWHQVNPPSLGDPYLFPYGNINYYYSSSDMNTYFRDTIQSNNFRKRSKTSQLEDSIETGRVEKGSASNQTFDYDNNTKFQTICSHQYEWHIFPSTQEPISSKEVNAIWCGECGRKRKKDSFKFCPFCGTEYL